MRSELIVELVKAGVSGNQDAVRVTAEAIAAEERGLLPEHIDEYERHLAGGRYLLAADVRWQERPHVRGAMLESGASLVRDVVGTFEPQRVTSARVKAPRSA